MSKEVNTKDIMDLLDGRRKFEYTDTDGVVQEYYIGTPTAEDIRVADWEHAKKYNLALKEGIFTVSEMMDILKKRRIIGEEYDKVGEELRVQMGEKIVEMERENDREARMRLALEVSDMREEVFQWNQRLSSPLAHTCENLANDSRVECITSAVVQKADGSRLWADFDDYRLEENLALQTKARFEVMLWLEGVESDFLERAPENLVLKEIADVEKLEASAPTEDMIRQVEEADDAVEADEVEEAVEEVEDTAAPETKSPDVKPATKKRARARKTS